MQPVIFLEQSLGQRAPDRGQVELLVEASRLKFSPDELAELKRLYGDKDLKANAKPKDR